MKRKILITMSLILVASMLLSFGAYATEKTSKTRSATLWEWNNKATPY